VKLRVGRRVLAVLRPVDVAELELRVGSELHAARLEAIEARRMYVAGMDAALRLLRRRALSEAELTARLAGKGFEGECVASVVGRLRELELIDDRAFAREALRQTTSRLPAGERLMRELLDRHGVESDVAEEAVSAERAASPGEDEQMRELIESRLKSMRSLSPEAQARRLLGLLARRGFEPEAAEQIIREFIDPGD
jgi:regulatory protein